MEISSSLRQAILDYRKGDKEAFTTIYKESEKYLYSCIYKVAKGNDDAYDMTADVMSDTYLEISQKLDTLGDIEKFLSWAGTIATRKCYAYIKKNKKEILIGEEDTTFDDLADDDNIIPEEVMQNREAQRLLREIIDNELNEMQKLCIIGVYYNEQKQSEIAKELGIPENTVKTHLSRAKAKIKAGVEELNIKKGTKLFSVLPFFLLLFKEEAKACEVPASIGAKVLGTVGVSASAIGAGAASGTAKGGATGIKGLIAKITGASTKAKIIGTAATVAVAGAGTGAIVYNMNTKEPSTWQEAYTDYLLNTEDNIDRFDLHDFDGDGSPEMVCSNSDGVYSFFTFKDNEFSNVYYWEKGHVDQETDAEYENLEVRFGYGLNDDEVIRVDYGDVDLGNGDVRKLLQCHIYNYKKVEDRKLAMPRHSHCYTINCNNSDEKLNSNNIVYREKTESDIVYFDVDEGIEKTKEAIFNQYVAIDFTPVRSDYITEHNENLSDIILKRVTEYENMGNRKPVPFGLQF